MLIDPLLLTFLAALLVVSIWAAIAFYVRYRRCEDIYQAYAPRHQPSAPEPAFGPPLPVEERYITGADYAEAPPSEPQREEIVSALIEPPVSSAGEVPEEPYTPADAFFYEYTAEGFVPVDPYEHSGSPLTPAEEEPSETPEPATFTDPLAPEDPMPPQTEETPPVEEEDGFVWL